MIVLHIALLNGQLVLWAEGKSEGSSKPQTVQRGRRKSQELPFKNHPFAINFEALQDAFRDTNIDIQFTDEQRNKHLAWIPSLNMQPTASNPLLAPKSVTGVYSPELSAWLIQTATLDTHQALKFLKGCVGKKLLKPGVVLGNEVSLLIQSMHWAATLVVRQKYLPGVAVVRDQEFSSVWEPLFIGRDYERLKQLSSCLPSALRCLTLAMKQKTPPTISAETVLREWVMACVNYLVTNEQTTEANVAQNIAVVQTKRKITNKKNRYVPFDTLHDEWLHRLQLRNMKLREFGLEHQSLAQQVADWKRPVTVLTSSPFKLALRLEEPKKEHRNSTINSPNYQPSSTLWYVRFLLQAQDDPSLLVDIKQAWNPKGTKKKALERPGFDARHYSLSSLGLAAEICPQVEKSLKSPVPHGYEVDVHGAFEFLNERASLFEEAGFSVILPIWWSGKKNRLGLKIRGIVKSPKMKASSGKTLWEMVKINWEVALGGKKIPLEELEALAQLKEPLVLMRGEWVQLNQEEIQAAIKFWKNKKQQLSLNDIMQMSLGVESQVHGIEIEGIVASGWVGDFLNQLQGHKTIENLPQPAGFEGTLRPYQMRGYSWMSFLRKWGLGACLADDMGLGKTPQTLVSVQYDWENSQEKKPVLLICPTSLTGNWSKEAQKFTPSLPVMIHYGSERHKGKAFKKAIKDHGLVITSYHLLIRDIEQLKEIEWGGIILDEAQYIKNAEAKQAQATFTLKADYRLALTGTPVENNVGDLWSIMHFLNPGFLGAQTEFKRTFFLPIQMGRCQETTERLKRLTCPFILRRLKTDKTIINDLPEKMEMKVYCTLTKEQASLYEAVVHDASGRLENAEGIQRKGIILSTLMLLKQICNHPTQFLKDNILGEERSGKLLRLSEMVSEIVEKNERTLIFTQFFEMGEILQQHFQTTLGQEVLFLHGGTKKIVRDEMVDRFQLDEKGPKIFILSLKAGGTGLNLTRANHVFHFDRWWNPAVENQAMDRAFRIGQKRNVQVHKFICAGTLEDHIDDCIENKKVIANSVVGTGEGWLTELSTNELKELWKLRKEAF